MSKRRSRAFIIMLALTMILSGMMIVNAESESYNGTAVFTGSKIESSFSSGTIAAAVSDLQPGDDVTFTVEYTNAYDKDTDWYMSNEVLQTLEKSTDARKVTGVGSAENGGYTYELVHYDKNGEETVLFSNAEVGGEEKPNNMEGLEQATNALDDWFYIQTLSKNETGKVKLHVAFEGETEVNNYMDTSGGLELKFAVEIHDSPGRKVKTGDNTGILLWTTVLLLSSVLMFILVALSRRKDLKTAEGSDRRTGGDAK